MKWSPIKRGLLMGDHLDYDPFGFYIHHIMVRGIIQSPIFLDDKDRILFLLIHMFCLSKKFFERESILFERNYSERLK